MPDFREALDSGRVILLDGAMGTEIYRRGVFINRCFDDLCRTDPNLVREVHAEYRKAGAQVLETNTFGANRFRLQGYGLESQVGEVNAAAAALAREVAGDGLFVAGSIGPIGVRLEPYGATARSEAREAFREQAAALAEAGVDLFTLETFSDLEEIRQAIEGCHAASDLPIIAQVTIQPNGETTYGDQPEHIAESVRAWGVDAIGLNCSVGPAIILAAIQKMARVTDLPLSAVPNAGLPQEVHGRKIYLADPEYMAGYARRLVQAGVRIVGGCCGTTPAHIREMATQVRVVAQRAPRVRVGPTHGAESPVSLAVRDEEATEPAPIADRSAWGRKLGAGEMVTSVEILPPRGTDASDMLESCRWLKGAGVDAVNVPDGARAMMRMGVIAASALIEREVGIETVVHYCCRDRNLLGMMSDLIGAQALGLRNMLLITGDPPKMGPYPDATAVFDIDSVGLTNLVSHLNHGLDLGGNALGSSTSFVVGVGVNPGAVDVDEEIEHWYWKVQAGAEFGVTQPVFDVETLVAFLERIEKAGTRIPIVAGIWPLVSLRNAEFLNNEVPGIEVPDRYMDRMRDAQERGKEQARGEGCAIAREMLSEVADLVEGVQVSAPFGKVPYALDVFAALEGYPTLTELEEQMKG
ncbi:MAG: bifunctional homocysteine S-methyltransferase/methylenetetrahydrofolate reductase [Gemmatimonadales bacterium]